MASEPASHHRGQRRHQLLLGARPCARAARSPQPGLLYRDAPGTSRAMKFGIDRLLADPDLRKPLESKRVALLAHPASVTADLTHSLDSLVAAGINVSAMFGPQHCVRGDLQDNMIESPDYTDATYNIPVFSLYGEVRRPSGQSMGTFDTILIDLQDVGCRIYTFVTTLLYVLEAAAEHGKSVWVLARPPDAGRGFGGPPERVWINPSPNAANVNMARAYAGTVMLEGTNLSEGRGTTRPLELFGAPDIDAKAVIAEMHRIAPHWLTGCTLRDIWFQPTFHKHAGQLCSGVFIHAEGAAYDHEAFKPWRLQALGFKAIRALYPDYDLWRDFPYEYEFDKLAIDVINAGPGLREWVHDAAAGPGDLDAITRPDEAAWADTRRPHLLY